MTTKTELLQKIRKFCIDCCGGSYKAVKECPSANCVMHPHRMGTDPTAARSPKNKISVKDETDADCPAD